MKQIHFIHQREAAPQDAVVLEIQTYDRKGLLDALSKSCQFPDYFGHNWNAAWDLLQETDVKNLLVHLTPKTRVQKDDWRAFLSLFDDLEDIPDTPVLWIFDERPRHPKNPHPKPPKRGKSP